MLTPERQAEAREAIADSLAHGKSSGTWYHHFVLDLLDAADERDRLAAALRQIAEACHWSHDPSGDPEALIAYIGQLQRSTDDALDTAERVRALHERDGEGFCHACDYMTPHPCPTIRALDGTDDGTAT